MKKEERKEYLASLEGAILSDEEWARELYGSVTHDEDTPPFDDTENTSELR